MKIVLATPLYPPEIAQPAPYIKELAKRLMEKEHSITVVTYGHLPEQIPGVKTIVVNKKKLLMIRLFLFTKTLLRVLRTTDILYVQNGASVELPISLASFLTRKSFVMGIGDTAAHNRSKEHRLLSLIENAAKSRAKAVINDLPKKRPEIIPFEEYPSSEMKSYEKSWEKHLNSLLKIF